MGIDVSIFVSSPLVYSNLYIFSLLFLFSCLLPPPFLVNLSILSAPLIPVNSFFLFLSSCFYPSHFSPTSPLHLPQLSSALMFDAVHVVVGAVRELNRSQEIGVKPLSCTSPQIWQHGTSLMNYLRMVKLHIYYMSKAGNKM